MTSLSVRVVVPAAAVVAGVPQRPVAQVIVTPTGPPGVADTGPLNPDQQSAARERLGIFVQPDQPTIAPLGAVWIQTPS